VLYRRILVKLSGESLHGPLPHGIHRPTLTAFAQEILATLQQGSQVAVLIGGGNLFRGAQLTQDGYARVTGDQIGMLSTVINGLALQDVLESLGAETRLMTSVQMDEVAEPYIRRRAIRHLEHGRILILVAGMGRPYFSTDTAAVQRALEIGADAVLKGTRVDGVYDKDPEKYTDAKFYDCLSYTRALEENLRILDTAAFALSRENGLPLIVLNVHKPGTLAAAARGEQVGTLVNETGARG
jgi:uridylate kinase